MIGPVGEHPRNTVTGDRVAHRRGARDGGPAAVVRILPWSGRPDGAMIPAG